MAISDYTAGMFREACPQLRRIVPIPNGVEVEQFAAPVPRPANVAASIRPKSYLLFLGRLDPRKGVDVLLEAMVLLRGQCNLDLVVAGRGPEGPALEALSARLGLARKSISSARRRAGRNCGCCKTAFARSSLREPGRPLASWSVESLAAGRPVIASQLPGLADLIQPGRTGLLVPPESPQKLAEAIVQIALDPRRADDWGQTARRFVQAFDWRNIALRHIDLFEELIADKQRTVLHPGTAQAASPPHARPVICPEPHYDLPAA